MQVCVAEVESLEYYSLCLHTWKPCIVFKILNVQQIFSLFTAIYFFACVHDRYDTINSYLTQIFMCATVNVKTMLLDFFYLRATNYQLNSSPYDYKFCYTLLCTSVYKISKLIHNTYTKILSGYKSKNVHEYRICKLVHDSYH